MGDRLAPIAASEYLPRNGKSGLLEEEGVAQDELVWLLNEGVLVVELRDEILCQLMKQLTHNPWKDSNFKGWQFLCVVLVTFPPSKSLYLLLASFLSSHSKESKDNRDPRIRLMAKFCVRKLKVISQRGAKRSGPNKLEIESAMVSALTVQS